MRISVWGAGRNYTVPSPATHRPKGMHKPSRLETIALRGLSYAVRHWGPADAPRVFFLHGWMDSSATFQFVVDALQHDWHVIAPDWRGYGQSEYLGRPYWFPDYYADLDALLARYSPDEPARLVGHSMGANIGAAYAAARPERVARLVMLDFLGLLATQPDDAPTQLTNWLNAVGKTPRLNVYGDFPALAKRLRQANPRLSEAQATFLAENVGRRRADGLVDMACDPWHRVAGPLLYRSEEVMAYWRAIVCPVLHVIADGGYVEERFGTDAAEYQLRLNCFRHAETVRVAGSGHNIQHDQPESVARALEAFLTKETP